MISAMPLIFLLLMLCSSLACAGEGSDLGPLQACGTRFCSPDGTKVFLVGSHQGWELVDHAWGERPEVFDWPRFLELLTENGHNATRLWMVEHADAASGREATPMPWLRLPDGRFDLAVPSPEYLARLRERVAELEEREIYAVVMLFQGVSFWQEQINKKRRLEHWKTNVWNPANNVQGIPIAEPGWEVHRHDGPNAEPIRALQRTYIRAVVQSVAEAPNVLLEVSNEARHGSIEWHRWVVEEVREAQRELDTLRHPVGVSYRQGPEASNEELLTVGADWIGPKIDRSGATRGAPWGDVPNLVDSDHYWVYATDPREPRRVFEAGFAGFLLLDRLERVGGEASFDDSKWHSIRKAMGEVARP